MCISYNTQFYKKSYTCGFCICIGHMFKIISVTKGYPDIDLFSCKCSHMALAKTRIPELNDSWNGMA